MPQTSNWFLGLTCLVPESIEWFIEDRAFTLSYDLTPSSPSQYQVVSLSQSSALSPVEITNVWWGGGEPNHTMTRKPGPLYISHYSLPSTILPIWSSKKFCSMSKTKSNRTLYENFMHWISHIWRTGPPDGWQNRFLGSWKIYKFGLSAVDLECFCQVLLFMVVLLDMLSIYSAVCLLEEWLAEVLWMCQKACIVLF
jgi:hypothetical protein